MNYLLLAVSLVAGLTYNITRKNCMENHLKTQRDTYFFNAVSGLVTSCVLAVMMVIRGEFSALPSFFTVWLGAVFGIVTVLGAILNMKAYGMGPLSYSTVLVSCSMILPALFGVTRGEQLSWVHYVGIVMMLVCMVLSVSRDKNQKKANLPWFFCCLAAFACVGSVGILQQIHQTSDSKGELDCFLLIAFLISSAYAFVCYLVSGRNKTAPKPSYSPKKSLLWLCVVTGLGVAAANIINLYLSGVMPSAVFFPVVNGGGLILSALAGIVLFHETFSAKKWVGLGIGTGAILLLCLEKIL